MVSTIDLFDVIFKDQSDFEINQSKPDIQVFSSKCFDLIEENLQFLDIKKHHGLAEYILFRHKFQCLIRFTQRQILREVGYYGDYDKDWICRKFNILLNHPMGVRLTDVMCKVRNLEIELFFDFVTIRICRDLFKEKYPILQNFYKNQDEFWWCCEYHGLCILPHRIFLLSNYLSGINDKKIQSLLDLHFQSCKECSSLICESIYGLDGIN